MNEVKTNMDRINRDLGYRAYGISTAQRSYEQYSLRAKDRDPINLPTDHPELGIMFPRYFEAQIAPEMGTGNLDLVIFEPISLIGMLCSDQIEMQMYLNPFFVEEEWIPLEVSCGVFFNNWIFAEMAGQDLEGQDRRMLYISQLLPTTRASDAGYYTQ